jgi:hypothetical protein
VVLVSTVTGSSSGAAGGFTLAHSAMMSSTGNKASRKLS